MSATPFADLPALAANFRQQLATKKFILLYACNGTGKTRLSTSFKDVGKQAGQADTLYFNAFTEDLFSLHNDLDGDSELYLILHPSICDAVRRKSENHRNGTRCVPNGAAVRTLPQKNDRP